MQRKTENQGLTLDLVRELLVRVQFKTRQLTLEQMTVFVSFDTRQQLESREVSRASADNYFQGAVVDRCSYWSNQALPILGGVTRNERVITLCETVDVSSRYRLA